MIEQVYYATYNWSTRKQVKRQIFGNFSAPHEAVFTVGTPLTYKSHGFILYNDYFGAQIEEVFKYNERPFILNALD